MENQKVIDILRECGSLLEGHFLLSSGKHSDRYCQCAKLLQSPDKAAQALRYIVDQVRDLGVDLVVGPAMGGVVVAYEIARQLGVPGIFTERENNIMTLRRGFEVQPGQRVLVTEDVITTGKSTMETVKVLEEQGGSVVGVTAIVDRSGGNTPFTFPLYSATTLTIQAYSPDDCPLCRQNIPVVKPGSRKFSK